MKLKNNSCEIEIEDLVETPLSKLPGNTSVARTDNTGFTWYHAGNTAARTCIYIMYEEDKMKLQNSRSGC